MKKTISIRVNESVANQLSFLALEKGLTRQDFVEMYLNELVSSIKTANKTKQISYVNEDVYKQIDFSLSKLQPRQTTTLKKLVGPDMWNSFNKGIKLVFGKEFKVMVEKNLFEGLHIGKKKSNNEQEYNYHL